MINFHSKSIVHLDNFHYNLSQLIKLIDKKVSIIPVIKADAYGHGIVRIARELTNYSQVAYLGIAHIKEGVMLRKKGINRPILAMSCVDSFDLNMMDEFEITPVVHSLFLLDRIIEFAKNKGKRIKVHLKFDTGMARLGIREEEVEKAINVCLKNTDYLNVDGIMSHFSDSESDFEWTERQLNRFKRIVKAFEDSGIMIRLKHIANSGAIISSKKTHLNCVRPGLFMYGYAPSLKLKNNIDLKPVLEIQSQLVNIHRLKKGEGISYGRTFTADKDMKVGVVAFGYADGLFRSLSNRMHCIVNGKRVKQIGTICMDMFMCDLSDVKANVSDTVIIMNEELTAYELAEKSGTIPYEILTNIGKSIRVKRVYRR